MAQFRKKPVVIDAVQWTGDNLREVIDFAGLHPSAEKWTWAEYEAVVARDGLKIFTLEGPMMATPGDWIIKGVKGEFYPCKPDIFAATYESVDEAAARRTAEIEAAVKPWREVVESAERMALAIYPCAVRCDGTACPDGNGGYERITAVDPCPGYVAYAAARALLGKAGA